MGWYLTAGLVSGILFGAMDALINGNSWARRLFEVYRPIARTSVNIPAGILIDLFYGFALAAIFLVLYPSLPGGGGLVKGISFAVLVWFLRIVMSAAAEWMKFPLPAAAVVYMLASGFIEMLTLGTLYGLMLEA